MHCNIAQTKHIFHRKITITHSVDTVAAMTIKTKLARRKVRFRGKRSTGKRSSTEGAYIQPFAAITQTGPVSLEHFDVSKKLMSKQHGLSML
jgi:hypothetical protein